jgi:ABC-type nitrate/sulfonate/bicarbonate transport system permease component
MARNWLRHHVDAQDGQAVIRKIVVPQTIPFLLAALRYSLGISWKIATVVELIGMSSGVGYMLHYWFGLFSMTQVLAWTLTFTIILLLILATFLLVVRGASRSHVIAAWAVTTAAMLLLFNHHMTDSLGLNF